MTTSWTSCTEAIARGAGVAALAGALLLAALDGHAAGPAPGARVETDEQAIQRAILEQNAAAEREAEARAAAQRQAALKAANDRLAAARAAEERAVAEREAAKLAAERDRKRQVDTDVDRVMQRALADYPVLRSPEGATLMERIQARQQALVAKGIYPSIALAEAVNDYRYELEAKSAGPVRTVQPTAPSAAPAAPGIGGCRWKSAYEWSCK